MKLKFISSFAIIAALFSCCFVSVTDATTEGWAKATPTYDSNKKLTGCTRGGSGCTIKITGVPFGIEPPDGGSVGADTSTEVTLAEDLYQAVATNIDMPDGLQDVEFVVYSKTGRDILSDVSAYYPDIPFLY